MKQLIAFIMVLAMTIGIATAGPSGSVSSSGGYHSSSSTTPSNSTYRSSTVTVQRSNDAPQTRPVEQQRPQQAPQQQMQERHDIQRPSPQRRELPVQRYPNPNDRYQHGYPGANRGYEHGPQYNTYGQQYRGRWEHRPWTYSRPYQRIYWGNHWGFWLILAGIQTFIYEDTIGQCYYTDSYGVREPWCDPAYPDQCVCP